MIELQEGEYIMLKARKRWFVIFTHAFMMAILAFVPVILIPFGVIPYLQNAYPTVIAGGSFADALFYSAAWIWFVWMMFVVMWTNYYMDVLVITNKRIIDKEQFIFFSRDEITIPMDRIEDIKIEVQGVLQTVLKFGTVQIQTAGAKREVLMSGIKDPERVKATIDSVVQATRRGQYTPVEEARG